MTTIFAGIEPAQLRGPGRRNDFAFRHYDPDETVMGKRMEDHLRFAVAWWHSFAWPGGDPFGGQTFERPWFGDDMDAARAKADAAFELFAILGQPFFCFHDADVRPEGDELCRELGATSTRSSTTSARRWRRRARSLLWGTANLFTHRRYMAGAATNPDPDVFAYAAATVKTCMDATHRLGGAELRALGRARGLRDAAQHRPQARGRTGRAVPVEGRRLQAQDRLSRARS